MRDPQPDLGDQNGGFPEPPPGEPVRVVRAAHATCGADTEIRLPGSLAATVVRRVVCSGCAEPYWSDYVEDLGTPAFAAARRRRPGWTVAAASLLAAAAAVVAALLLIQGGSDEPAEGTLQGAASAGQGAEGSDEGSGGGGDNQGGGQGEGAGGNQADRQRGDGGGGNQDSGGGRGNGGGDGGAAPGNARLARESNFTLAIPPGWERSNPPRGATFAVSSSSGGADATLWVERDRTLSVREFESQSLERLKRVAGNARVASRTPAPTDAGTVIRLRAGAPAGQGGRIEYKVTLRAAGPFRYYLVTSEQPDARRAARSGVRLVHGSFIPEPEGAKKGGE